MIKPEPKIRTVILDVLKPFQPVLSDFALFLAGLDNISKVDISVVEMNEDTMSLKVTIDGVDIDFDKLRDVMLKQNAIIQSLDRVVVKK